VTQVEQRFTRMGRSLSDSQLSEIKKDVLEELINRELLLQESKKSGVTVEAAEVKEQLDQMRSQYATDAEFKRTLNMMGFSGTNIESQIKEWMEVRRFVNDRIAKKIIIPEKDIKASYDSHPHIFKRPESVHAAHILIKVDPAADKLQKSEARKEIAMIKNKLKRGEDFAALAKVYSQGPSSVKGGDLGYFGRGQMVKPFETAAFALKPGEVSGIVKTRFGYHIIKVFDKKPPVTIPYEDARKRIAQHLKNQKVQKQLNQYIDELKKNAVIKRSISSNP
jgi:peptidyl-prolyl cis-trans isomerase C